MEAQLSETPIGIALQRFVAWLQSYGYTSYDQYDFWAMPYGVWVKDQYYRHGKLFGLMVAPLVAADWLWPDTRRWFCPRRRFPIADAHYLMAFVDLYRLTGQLAHLDAAKQLAQALLKSHLPGFSGKCWGYPFDWQTKRGLWKQGTPFVTTTPYVFEAFLDLHRATGETAYLETAASIARFVAQDIRHLPAGGGLAASYTPFDDAQVLNASAYSAACLAVASEVFGTAKYLAQAVANTQFILSQQRGDGAWLYSANDPHDAFIDHFHTCFVLKGLYRVYCVTHDQTILRAIERGYAYYRQNLFYPNGWPRPFAQVDNAQFRVLELYDYAEALNLAVLLEPVLPTRDLASALADDVLTNWQRPAGFFRTRVSAGGIQNTVPYHRWAQAQMFRSLVLFAGQTR